MENLWEKIKNWFLSFLLRNNNSVKALPEGDLEYIQKNNIEIEQKENTFYKKAFKAFETYELNLDTDIGEKIYNTIYERLQINKENIENLLKLKKSSLTYKEIIELYDEEIEDLKKYKKTIKTEKIDNFLLSSFYVPIGVIGIETNDSKNTVKNIFKSITTRNAIIIAQNKKDEYSIEQLILIIVQEAFRKFKIDENIIQIVDKKEVAEDIEKFDIYIKEDGTIIKKKYQHKMYIYLEDEYFIDEVNREKVRLLGKEVEIIKDIDIDKAIEKINKNNSFGVSIYSRDGRKAYKFINLINSPNVFFNGTLLNAKELKKTKNEYLRIKNILCENILQKIS